MLQIRMRVGELIAEKSARDGVDLTATDVARAIGVQHNTILDYVRNKRNPNHGILAKLCGYFDCGISDILVLEEVDEAPGEAAAA